jgi:hypothetical protein
MNFAIEEASKESTVWIARGWALQRNELSTLQLEGLSWMPEEGNILYSVYEGKPKDGSKAKAFWASSPTSPSS